MSSAGTAMQAPENTSEAGSKRLPCPLYGCKRVYTDATALKGHIQDHDIPAQSVPGCSGSFPDMQRLMEHMRHHHKPNIYFLCENCRTKLRSYRGLLTHLHTCSKVPRGKVKPVEIPPLSLTPPQQEVEPPPPVTSDAPLAAPPLPAAPRPLIAPPRFIPPAPSAPPPVAEAGPPEEDVPEAPGSPGSPQPSAAIWRKNQGTACRRILWEHTKGRYCCVQCGHSVTNRKDMNLHISTYHSAGQPPEDGKAPGSSS